MYTANQSSSIFLFYILNRTPVIFITLKNQKHNDIALLVTASANYILMLHLRLLSFFQPNQLTDIFAYDAMSSPTYNSKSVQQAPNAKNIVPLVSQIAVFIVHALRLQSKFFFFVSDFNTIKVRTYVLGKIKSTLKSIDDFYKNAWWSEREISELFGINLIGKADKRNLLLQYGVLDYPMQKFFPTIGTSEVIYHLITDSVGKVPLLLQY